MYIVYYTAGSYDFRSQKDIFVTRDETKANNYKDKFNSILEKWRDYYYQHSSELNGTLIEEMIFYREINGCYINKIEER